MARFITLHQTENNTRRPIDVVASEILWIEIPWQSVSWPNARSQVIMRGRETPFLVDETPEQIKKLIEEASNA